MLAQNFLSAADLGLSEDQRAALIKTLVLMETEQLTPVKLPKRAWRACPGEDGFDRKFWLPFTGHFSMEHWRVRGSDCITVACIGGTAEIIGGVSFSCHMTDQLEELFMPRLKRRWGSISIERAAMALRSYLTDGYPNWSARLRRYR